MRKVVVLAEAAEDIEQARDFYDAQEAGIGDYYADSLLADIESLALYHGIHSRHFGLYRMLAGRFPFGIYYRETKNETQVIAVLDLRRDPTWMRSELSWRD
jgi:plasmid stabilization system protein ParE